MAPGTSPASLLALDPNHESCTNGRTVLTCRVCAGNPPRGADCTQCQGFGFNIYPCPHCNSGTSSASATSNTRSSNSGSSRGSSVGSSVGRGSSGGGGNGSGGYGSGIGVGSTRRG